MDAEARDFTWVDLLPNNIIETPPAISFTVSTEKFQGRVVFTRILNSEDDLELSATPTQLSLQAVASKPGRG